MKTLRFILGDQLSTEISSLSDLNPLQDVVCLLEVRREFETIAHHKQKDSSHGAFLPSDPAPDRLVDGGRLPGGWEMEL